MQTRNPQPLSREERTLKLIGEITPCPNCDGSGKTAYGACCRIPGHARECACVLCQWKNACHRNENEAVKAKATCVALEQERDDVREMFEDTKKVLEETIDERDQLRATLAQYEAALRKCRYALKASRRCLPSHGTYSEDLINAHEGAISAANALLEPK